MGTIDSRICVYACARVHADVPFTHCHVHRCERGNGGKGQTSWIAYK